MWLAAGGLLLLALASLFVGVADVTPSALLDPQTRAATLEALTASRLPRTAALILTGSSLAVAGMIMQMLARNRFVEPSTAGTIEAASFGMLMMLIFFPGAPVILKMTGSAAAALVGTAFFVYLIRRIPAHSPLLVPLAGIMLGAIIGSVTAFIAYRANLLQSLGAWRNGDFSLVISGRYEMLWLTLAFTLAAYLFADRFTIAALGADISRNLGLDYEKALAVGLAIVAAVSAIVVTTVGSIPFLGLVVPNLVSLAVGDNQRRALPWVALTGALLVLSCDMAGRLIVYPYEIPVGTVFGVVGGLVFLFLLLRRPARAS
ncbi:iron ABC transporter permease [Hoeflea olei]|uniref:Iron ABC transporter permease n=1 Tax=Hoeflea olei TaxID=1480615 RepID=A0A1C1YV81_9HYPH|nr:iron ABC transporter permease [Hoeflea olei]